MFMSIYKHVRLKNVSLKKESLSVMNLILEIILHTALVMG